MRPDDPHPGNEVTVAVVSHRCEDLLVDCLASLRDTRDVAMHVVVVDTASGDGTPDAARRAGVEVVALTGNVGFGRANNLVIRGARTPAVLVLNPDTVLPPGALRACLDELWARPEVGVLTPRLVGRDGRLDRRCRRGFPTPLAAAGFLTGLDRLPGPRIRAYTRGHLPDDRPCDVTATSGAFMLLRTAALRETGGFDERYFMYGEDVDLCLRLAARGWRCRYWPGAEVVHVGGGSGEGGRRTPAADAAFFRAMGTLTRDHTPGTRGAVTAAAVTAAAELGLAWSRLRRAATAGRGQPEVPTPDRSSQLPPRSTRPTPRPWAKTLNSRQRSRQS